MLHGEALKGSCCLAPELDVQNAAPESRTLDGMADGEAILAVGSEHADERRNALHGDLLLYGVDGRLGKEKIETVLPTLAVNTSRDAANSATEPSRNKSLLNY